MKHSLIYFALLACFFCIAAESVASEKPNIVLIISDDDDYENFGFMGNKQVHTPNLDRLARTGTLFTHAYCPTSLCRPSLASMLSGKLPHQHGIYTNYLFRRTVGNDKVYLDPKNSLPNLLKKNGYKTYFDGKYWEDDPQEMGFTHRNFAAKSAKEYRGFVRKGQQSLLDFVKEEGESPWFVWWAPLLPHLPHNAPQKYVDLFKGKDIPIPPYVKDQYKDEFKTRQIQFLAAEAWFDDEIGKFIQKLKDLGEYDNTIFMFYVDNGWTLGTPAKNSPYEKGLRTPMFVTSTHKLVPAQINHDPQYALDLYATILDYAGVAIPEDAASQSLRPTIEGKSSVRKETIFGATYAHEAYLDKTGPRTPERDMYALCARTAQWKYILYTQEINKATKKYIGINCKLAASPLREQGHEELYDLENDPYEMKNLAQAKENERLKADLRKKVFAWWKTTGGKELRVSP